MAERVRFELTVGVNLRRVSNPVPSATRPPFHMNNLNQDDWFVKGLFDQVTFPETALNLFRKSCLYCGAAVLPCCGCGGAISPEPIS